MLISPYWDPQLMLEDNKIVRSCWAPAFAAAGLE